MKTLITLALVFAITGVGLAQSPSPNIVDSPKGASVAINARSVLAAYTMDTKDEFILADSSRGAFTITLPPANKKYRRVQVKKTDISGNAITVDGFAAETIEGSASVTLTNQYQSVELHAVEGVWYLSKGPSLEGDITIKADSTGGNLGASSSLTGIFNSKLIPFGTMTNGTATAKTRTLMDDTPAAEFSAVTVTAAPADTQDATIARKGTNSLKLTWLAAAVAGDGVQWTAFSAEDWTTAESVGFWVYSSVPLAAGDLTFVCVDSTADAAFNIPAVAVANKWTWVEVDISSLATTNGDAVTNFKILASTAGAAKGAMNTYFDGGWKWDSTEELTLGVDLVDSPGAVRSLLSLTKANTGTHDFVSLAEDTDFFVHYESGNDFLVTVTNQSAAASFALVNHK